MELTYVYGLAAIIVALFLCQVLTGRFDPFAPVWMFLIGYTQMYVIQPLSYHEWALRVRGPELVALANSRALWGAILFLAVYFSGAGRVIASWLPRPPARWSLGAVNAISPVLIAWGLVCSGLMLRSNADSSQMSSEEAVLRSFPFVMMVAAVLLTVSGRSGANHRPLYIGMGVAVGALYVLIWMFNGKRSHSLIGVLATTCAFYVAKRARPSWPVIITTACMGVLAVGIAIGWRKGGATYERSFAGFAQFVGDFELGSVLESLNLDDPQRGIRETYETEEYGGYLVMLTAVPTHSDFDYGSNYLRVFTTFIPRFLWPSKPIFGREQWVNAWIAGSEYKRDATFTGPAIGILGAAQLNGGACGTAIVLTCVALLLRSAYEYFRSHSENALVQAWWSITFYNAWFMTVNDDPLVWFYYNWGFTTMPVLVFLWITNKFAAAPGIGTVSPATA